MTPGKNQVRVVTYNTHKGRGMDGRVRPDRIRRVLAEIDADIIALQEVLNISGTSREKDQTRFFSEELGTQYCIGQTRTLRGGVYGNVILSRFPIRSMKNHDISMSPYERRGCLRADIELSPKTLLHVFNIHLGVDYFERRRQTQKLIDTAILHNPEIEGIRMVMGDFNEWTLGLATQFMRNNFQSIDPPTSRRIKTFPGLLPILALDHIYFDPALRLKRSRIYRSRMALVASDHLPMVAEFEFTPE